MGNGNNPLITIAAGAIAAVVIALIEAGLSIWLESEYSAVMALGLALVGAAVRTTVDEKSVFGGIVGLVMCSATILLYNFVLKSFGYEYADGDSTKYVWLVVGAIVGAWIGFNSSKD